MIFKRKQIIIIILLTVVAVIAVTGLWLYNSAYARYEESKPTDIFIPEGTDKEQLEVILKSRLGDYGAKVYRMWALRDGKIEKAHGYYIITPGDKAWSVASRLIAGRSSTVDITFNNVRTIEDLARVVSKPFPWTPQEFMTGLDVVLPDAGFSKANYPAAFIPDTYQFYGDATPIDVIKRLTDYYDRFWTNERKEKANRLGLTPTEVVTLASIVEEESNDREERPLIASLYLNRLKKGMKLQADPTVKFALGDFALSRITGKHLEVESPYNTYRVTGLPPGPIRIPDARTIDAVLNSPSTDYIYMCADEKRPGHHNFTNDYNVHLANAARYRAWLDSKGIK